MRRLALVAVAVLLLAAVLWLAVRCESSLPSNPPPVAPTAQPETPTVAPTPPTTPPAAPVSPPAAVNPPPPVTPPAAHTKPAQSVSAPKHTKHRRHCD